ncbi:DUF2461 domain-containing protein [Flavobacterium sp. JP2137]|uniref:DUF2461 domain-containing protein n=1 Tax=Flavobacterium sp. JP2137 TaxID=3414510 RepID=UPI003D2FCE76
MNKVPATAFDFLNDLKQNNNRPWFVAHKSEFDAAFGSIKDFFKSIYDEMQSLDSIERFHVHRIYRDVRFAKDKTPYKDYFGLHLGRSKPLLRGGYYVSIEPGKSFVGGGFWEPDKTDLLRIRKDIEQDDSELRSLIEDPEFITYFGGLSGEELKTAPKGFDKEHPAIDLLRKKQFLVMRSFSDEEVLAADFGREVIKTFVAMRPWFDYMSEVLTTDANGVDLFS